MFKLMKLEMKKFKLSSYSRSAIIANFVILGFMFLISFISKMEGDIDFVNYQEAIGIIESFVRATFIIFAATLIAKLVIGEFKNKTITTLFMYPISRKKLIAAKLAIVVIFTFTWILISNAFITTVYYFITVNYQMIPGSLTAAFVREHSVSVLMNAVSASCMALIPIYFGMKKYSIPTTIITSILIVMIVSNNNGSFSLNDIIVIPLSLAAIGLTIAYLAIRNIDRLDIRT